MIRPTILVMFLAAGAGCGNAAEPLLSHNVVGVPVSDGKPIMLPFHLNNDGFILIDGEVDGTPGVFWLDTGMPFRFILNRHYVPLGEGVTLTHHGHAASGQAMVFQSHTGSRSIQLAGARFSAANGSNFITDPDAVLSANFGFIEQDGNPHFLGMIGWEFLKNYVFVLDYNKRIIPLYPVGTGAAHTALERQPDKSVVIRFRPSSPQEPFALEVSGVTLPAVLDTGGHERLAAPANVWARLAAAGPLPSKRNGDDDEVSLKGARYQYGSFDLPDLQKVISAETMTTLGYPFLRHYRSTWNISESEVLLEPE